MILTDPLSIALEPDVLAAQRGDRNAFARLVDASRNAVCAITFAVVRDVARSEDLAQEVYLAAWTSIGKLQSPSSFLPWLRQLTRNHAHTSIRSAVRYRKRHAGWTDGVTDAVDPATSAEALLVSREEETALADAIAELPDETREVVTLFYREGQSVRQVGELLGLTEPAVKKRLERAREALRATTLERLGEVARKSAPTAGFTLAVTAAIHRGEPACPRTVDRIELLRGHRCGASVLACASVSRLHRSHRFHLRRLAPARHGAPPRGGAGGGSDRGGAPEEESSSGAARHRYR